MTRFIVAPFITSCILLTACGGSSNNSNSGGSGDVNTNQAPTASVAQTQISVDYETGFTLDASGSTDPEGSTLNFQWSGDVDVASPTEATTTVTAQQVGTYTFTVTVSDGDLESTATVTVEVTGPATVEKTNIATGSVAEPKKVYYDIDSGTVLELTEAEADSNEVWDIAFKRTEVSLNYKATAPASLYFTENTGEFYEDDGSVIVDRFINATPSNELAAFEALNPAIPADEQFNTDEESSAISGYYIYNPQNHTVAANPNAYFVVSSDDALTKFRATALVQSGFGMESITLETAYQATGEAVFAAAQTLDVDLKDCAGPAYIDLDTNAVVLDADNWDIMIPCDNNLGTYEINLTDDAQAISGNAAEVDGIPAASFPFYDWSSNTRIELALLNHSVDRQNTYGWGEYGVNGGHTLWPNYATFIIKTAQGYYKFQVTGYYDTDTSASGSYSFRHQKTNTTINQYSL